MTAGKRLARKVLAVFLAVTLVSSRSRAVALSIATTASFFAQRLTHRLSGNYAQLSPKLHASTSPSLATETTSGAIGAENNLLQQDSVQDYAQDIAVVLKEMRADEKDPTLARVFRETSLPSFSNTWTLEDWNRHTSRIRYIDYIRTLPGGRLTRRVFPQLSVLIAWSCVSAWLCSKGGPLLSKVTVPLTPLSLVSTFVAALLTLRSNQGLSRLNEGRVAIGKVVLYTRDMAQLIVASIYPKDRRLGLKLLRHVALFGWLVKNFLRGEKVNGTDEDIVRTMLPVKADADYVLRQRKKPVAVVTRLRQVFTHMAEIGQLSTAEEIALDHVTQELNHCIMTTERIRASPIPPLYTVHAGQLLMFYLTFLPLALRGSGMLDGLGTVITTTAVGFAMLGLDEISHLLEQPFKLMPLYQLSKNSMKDVGDALVCEPPSLDGVDSPDWTGPPPYWS